MSTKPVSANTMANKMPYVAAPCRAIISLRCLSRCRTKESSPAPTETRSAEAAPPAPAAHLVPERTVQKGLTPTCCRAGLRADGHKQRQGKQRQRAHSRLCKGPELQVSWRYCRGHSGCRHCLPTAARSYKNLASHGKPCIGALAPGPPVPAQMRMSRKALLQATRLCWPITTQWLKISHTASTTSHQRQHSLLPANRSTVNAGLVIFSEDFAKRWPSS